MNAVSSNFPPDSTLSVRDRHGAIHAIPIVLGQSVARLVYTSGLFEPPPLCNGLGRCGRCAMRFISMIPAPSLDEQHILGPERIAAGFRLACRHTALAGMSVETDALLIADTKAFQDAHFIPRQGTPPRAQTAACPLARLAIDLGTTSLQWSALYREAQTGEWRVRASGATVNPQMGFGADVMSRIAAALIPQNRDRMRALTVAALNRILPALPTMHDARPQIEEWCVSANPAMTGTLLCFDMSGLAAAPYRLPYAGNSEEHIDGLAAPVYFPAQASPFVGGDISAGIADLLDRLPDREFPFLYADMGTNGEFVLALSRELSFSASVPMGPALEGIGLAHGRAATKDAPRTITAFSLTPSGIEAVCAAPPLGISGTGYLSLVHCLLRAGLLDRDGRFIRNPASPLGARLARQGLTDAQDGPAFLLGDGLALYARDIEEMLKVKAAFSLAVTRLLDAAGIEASAVRGWHAAGAMGSHVNPADIEALGFLPPGAGLRFHARGNMALRGAQNMLGRRAEYYRETAARWAQRTRLVELTARPEMLADFARRMRFAF